MKNMIFKTGIIFFGVFSYFLNTQAFFEIIEILPNTTDDKNLEYILLKNTSDTDQGLDGYVLSDLKKEYTISHESIIESGEIVKFLRPETKIVLNNSNEEITLQNPEGEIIDQKSYKSSTKGEPILFEEKSSREQDETEEFDEKIISNEVSIISDEAKIINDDVDIKLELSAPEIQIHLQRPSYVEYSEEENMYFCDTDREECKVNFDLRESFTGDYSESDYICQIDFGFGVITGQEEKCNPNTVIFPEGKHEVKIKITHEDDENILSEKSIFISNVGVQESSEEKEEGSQEEIVGDEDLRPEIGVEILNENNQDNVGVTTTSSNQETQQDLSAPDINMSLQIPSYVEYSEDFGAYICDPEKEECKVNFDLRESFTGDYSESDYICQIDFGFGVITGQEEKCNPNTVIFPEGEHEVKIKITHEDDENILSEKIIFISNVGVQESSEQEKIADIQTISQNISQSSSTVSYANIHIQTPKIIVQSGLSGNGRYFYCEKEVCKINLNYKKLHTDERCFWNFGEGVTSSSSTHTRCNPGYVEFGKGSHELFLKVYEKENETNFKKYIFYVYNNEVTLREKEITVENSLGRNSEDKIYGDITITLQGKVGSEKNIISENMIECIGVEKCYINLTSQSDLNIGDSIFNWKVNGEIFSEKQNPAGIWVYSGETIITLEVIKDGQIISEKYFYVSVDNNKIIKKLEQEINSKSTSNTSEKKELGNTSQNYKDIFTQNFLVLKYDGLRISGKTPVGSRVEIYLNGEKILEGESNEQGKYRIVSSDFKAGEYIFDTKIILENGEEIYIENSGEFTILEEKIQNWISEGEKLKKAKAQNLKKIFTQNFLILKYDGLRISGKAPIGSTIEIYIDGKKILEGKSNEKGKYRVVTKNLKAGMYIFDTKIVYPNGEVLYIENSGEFEILNSKIGNWFLDKTSQNKKSSGYVSNIIPKLILKTAEISGRKDDSEISELNFYHKLGLYFIVSLIALFSFGHLLLNIAPQNTSFMIQSQKILFGTRGKISLIF